MLRSDLGVLTGHAYTVTKLSVSLCKNAYTSWEKHNILSTKDWGTSVGGKETLTSNQALPSEAYQLTKEGAEKVTLEFVKGELIAVNGKKTNRLITL
jgi:argininosuccinate synthase